MKTPKVLNTKRELLLAEMHARRLLIVRQLARQSDTELVINHSHVYFNSVVMRFIFRQPHLCLWALSEIRPLLSGKKKGGIFKRLSRAFFADLCLPSK